ncbi:hypothetical protein [Microvirga sp. 2TAF3]|uniref:hypothetical protein n=1 Tax=Microvirga sp. 2TAF3 TaxID=3233014 RepID=UPI003F944103
MSGHLSLQRRTFLKIVSLAAAAETLPAWVTMADEAVVPDALAAWLRSIGNRTVVATLAEAHTGFGWRTIGSFEVAAHASLLGAGDAVLTDFVLRRDTTETGRNLLKVVAARGWQIPLGDCEVHPGRMVNRVTGHQLPYRIVLTV